MTTAGRPFWRLIARSILVLSLTYAVAPVKASAQAAPAEEDPLPAPAEPKEGKDEDLALKLQNPVADLISVPFQSNYDGRIGPGGSGNRYTLNIQPVIPIEINSDWNLISRTITPIVSQWNVAPNSGSQSGLGDVVQSLFLSPDKPTDNGVIWGVGPVLLLPTGTQSLLSAHQFGMGPTAVALKQSGGWTMGVLANHIWSVVETTSSAKDVSATFFQPFVSYTTKSLWTFTLNTESTYNWQTSRISAPLNAMVSKLVVVDKQPISFSLGLRYYVASPQNGPKGFGARASIVFLFPK